MLRRAIAGLAFVIALAVSAIAPAAAQSGPMCDRFGEGTAGLSGWGPCPNAPNIVVDTSNVNSIGGPTDYYLHLRDLSGASAACSRDPKYVGDWNAKMGGCGEFCFDFKVFKSGTPPGPITPSFTIWSGTLSATFVANFTVTSSDPWRQHICAPINLIDPGDNLPSGGSGQWRINPTGNAYSANWNTIIQNVTSVQLPIDWTSDPSEEAGYDNLCMSLGGCGKKPPPPVVTGCLSDAKVAVKCNGDGTYTLTLSGGGFTGNQMTLTSATAGVTVTPAQQPWAATTTWTLAGGTPGEAVTLEANETKIGGGSKPGTDECCSGEIKLTLPDCPKPTPVDVKIAKEEAKMPVGEPPGTHWFDLTVTNNGAAFTYPAGSITVTDSVPAGMTVTSATGTGWTCLPPTVTGPGPLTCTYTPGGTLGVGASLPPILVKTKMTVTGTVEQCAAVALGTSSGLTDSDPSNNKSCVKVTTRELCEPPLVMNAAGECVKPTPVDVKIAKVEAETPIGGPPGTHWFDLNVTNNGAAFTYPPGSITVTDSVPAGMTVTSATGTGWVCTPPTVTGPAPLTCTYTPGGTLGVGASLPPILVKTKMTEPGTVEQCAAVTLGTSSGLTDSNPSNNKSCVKVTTRELCKPPLVPNAAGVCACPTGTVLIDGQCVKVTTCKPPLVPNALGQCGCPTGEALVRGQCIKEPVCKPPLVPNALGQCGCPIGEVLVRGQCIKEPVCKPPLVPNAMGQCGCPSGEALVRGQCIKEPVCKPPLVPNAMGQCGCPTGEALVRGQCIKEPVCKPPLVPNAMGQCGCPSGEELVRGQCIKEPVCKPPLVPNAMGQCGCPAGEVAQGGTCVNHERAQPGLPLPGLPLPEPGTRENPREPGVPQGQGQGQGKGR